MATELPPERCPPEAPPSSRRPADHKLVVPQGHWNAIARRDLLGRMFAPPPHEPRVVVLQAPAGHGKTSLLLQAEATCRARGCSTGWLTLDDTDDDASRLFDHLLDLADRLTPDSRHEASSHRGQLGRPPRESRVVERFASVSAAGAVFIDDVHFVRNRAALGLLADLLARPLPGIRWFIGTRTHLPIGSTRLVVTGHAMVIDAEALRFSPSEAREFFDQSLGARIPESELRAITEATEGWPAALQLYRLARASGDLVPGAWQGEVRGSGHLTEYLSENVLQFQEPRVRDFLLATCVLERMCADLCDEMLDRSDSAEMLGVLEQRGLFVRRLSTADGWFTYHMVFATFLRDQLRRGSTELVTQLHLRAASWFDTNGHLEEALRHYAAAGDLALAADVFDRWLDNLIPDGHMVTVERWLGIFPTEVLVRFPTLMVKVLWALAFLSRHQKRDEILHLWTATPRSSVGHGSADPAVVRGVIDVLADDLVESERFFDGIEPDPDGRANRFRTFELGVVCNARGYRHLAEGDLSRAIDVLSLGRRLNHRIGSMFALAYSTGKTALVLMSQARLVDALELWATTRSETMQHLEGSLAEASLVSGHISGLYESGEHDRLLAEFDEFRELIEVGAIHDYLVLAHRSVARAHALRGETAAAVSVLERGQGLAHAHQWPRAARLLVLERARLELLAGRSEQARVMVGGVARSTAGTVVRCSEEIEDEHIFAARLHLHRGSAERALEVIAPVLQIAARQGRALRQIKLQLLAAAAHKRLGDRLVAHRRLAAALDLAAPGNCRQSFLDEGDEILELLDAHRESVRSAPEGSAAAARRRFIEALRPDAVGREAGRGALGGPPERSAARIELTDREKEVLIMVGNSMTNVEIARATFVTQDTVKYHLKNIYAKVGARNRIHAVRIAQDRGYC
ncbi:LuxR C-terminal-related transcriptional regulator [Pseudonocardia petroleophila]